MTYSSTKTFGHEIGLSCAFRQWRAESHCQYLHGYALSFKFTFVAKELDKRNWVVDFGGLRNLKESLQTMFDHKTVVAKDDPMLASFQQMEKLGICQLSILDDVGCEAFADYAFEVGAAWIVSQGYWPRVNLQSVEVAEHGANSAIYFEKGDYNGPQND